MLCKNTKHNAVVFLALIGALACGCATTTRSSTTWAAPPESAAAPASWKRYGHVAYVREIVQRTDGNPAGGAVAGALIGALIGGRGPAALFGAAGGAAVGASVSQGHSETRRYDVTVRFDDGTMHTFSYAGYAPFNPGEAVVQTPRGLSHG